MQHNVAGRRNSEGQLGHGTRSQDPVSTPAAVEALANFEVQKAFLHAHV